MFSKSMTMFPIPIQTHCFCFSSCVSPMTVAQCKQRGLSAYDVLGQGLSSVRDSAALFLSHYCAQLQNKLMAWLQSGSNTVVHLYISNSMLAAENYDLALIIALCWWGMHVQYKALFQKCLTVSDRHFMALNFCHHVFFSGFLPHFHYQKHSYGVTNKFTYDR